MNNYIEIEIGNKNLLKEIKKYFVEIKPESERRIDTENEKYKYVEWDIIHNGEIIGTQTAEDADGDITETITIGKEYYTYEKKLK